MLVCLSWAVDDEIIMWIAGAIQLLGRSLSSVKRIGLARAQQVMVLESTVSQWSKEFCKLYNVTRTMSPRQMQRKAAHAIETKENKIRLSCIFLCGTSTKGTIPASVALTSLYVQLYPTYPTFADCPLLCLVLGCDGECWSDEPTND